jgi:hypothetical protein
VRALILLGFLAACGAKTPAPGPVGNATPDAGPVVLAPGCPATWAELHATGEACEPSAVTQTCTYPEGSCWCGKATPCTGVELPEEYYDQIPTTWQCAEVPPAVRADGCPGVQPEGACADDGKACTYGSCCVTQVVCQGGQWVAGMASCPP